MRALPIKGRVLVTKGFLRVVHVIFTQADQILLWNRNRRAKLYRPTGKLFCTAIRHTRSKAAAFGVGYTIDQFIHIPIV